MARAIFRREHYDSLMKQVRGADATRRAHWRGGFMDPLLEVHRCRLRKEDSLSADQGPTEEQLHRELARLFVDRCLARDAAETADLVAEAAPGHPEGVPGPGLVQGAKFHQRPKRYGLQGLTNQGRKRVLGGCRLLEEDRRLLSFWTVTLPGPALRAMEAVPGGCAAFQEQLRRELERCLKAKGLSPEAVGVAEVQPERLKRTGVFAPHWHLVFRGRKSRGHAWALSRRELDHLIALCIRRITGLDIDCSKAGNVQQVRKSVAAYLGRYMKKGLSAQAREHLASAPVNLIPKQWWLMTNPLREALVSRRFPVDPAFLHFVDSCNDTLKSLGLIFSAWHFNEEAGIWIHRLAFPDLTALGKVVDLFRAESALLRDLQGEAARPLRWFASKGHQF